MSCGVSAQELTMGGMSHDSCAAVGESGQISSQTQLICSAGQFVSSANFKS
jgi:hypothetical protein